ncbi:hypothetical protein CDL15_Pgr016321 [Punica granatum]|uniref:Uncharacterized protein n=1 Tax=Punica granatum TaxID=22663 RepID=A0A218W7D3_PUNGR|nr:hypothetical protein CDL15_Pgr016321 [Punica granatum]PKI44129.1 hypothetical protein CRG98_035473 [Punica granatum]
MGYEATRDGLGPIRFFLPCEWPMGVMGLARPTSSLLVDRNGVWGFGPTHFILGAAHGACRLGPIHIIVACGPPMRRTGLAQPTSPSRVGGPWDIMGLVLLATSAYDQGRPTPGIPRGLRGPLKEPGDGRASPDEVERNFKRSDPSHLKSGSE